MDDRSIITLFWQRDEAAIRETADKYGRLCLSLSRHILGSPEDAEECVNDAYLALWKQIPPDEPKSFSAYLLKIVNNLSLKRYEYNQAKKRRPEALLSLNELEDVIGDEAVRSSVEAEELGEALNRFLAQQKEEIRKIFVLRYWFDLPVSEIAARMKMSESKILTDLYRCRRKLRAFLESEGISL